MSDFALEKEMVPVVCSWLESQGMWVRPEVWMPTGICDLVACSFNAERLALRVQAGYKPRSTRQSARDIDRGAPWLPLHERILFIELKLARRAEAWRQALRHCVFGESYVAMPYPACDYRPLHEVMYAPVGVLRVDREGVTVLRAAARPSGLHSQTCRVVDSMASEAAMKRWKDSEPR